MGDKNEDIVAFSRCWDLVANQYPKPIGHATYQALTNDQRDLLRENMKKDAKELCLI